MTAYYTAGLPPQTASRDGSRDLLIEAGERREERRTLLLQALDGRVVLVSAPLTFVELARREELFVIDAGNARRDLVTEVRVAFPRDRSVGDRLDDGRGDGDLDLLR